VREWSQKIVHSFILTHGHVDHVGGIFQFENEGMNDKVGRKLPFVVAHKNVAKRFDRYKLTNGYNSHINMIQFRIPTKIWPDNFRYPDITYEDKLQYEVGNVIFYLHHDKGETDDSTWIFVPKYKLLCTGDLFIWASPNCGNPQKVQRYPKEWAAALRKMQKYEAELLFPGHGPPIIGKENIYQALDDTATYLENILDQVIALMNEGTPLNQIIHTVKAPQNLLKKPYLKPVYDEPEFIVRNLWRLYGGWYDGNISHLKPALDSEVSKEIVKLSGGNVEKLVKRAKELLDKGELRLASHIIEFAYQFSPDDEQVNKIRSEICEEREKESTSFMAKSLFLFEKQNSENKLNKPKL